MIGSDTISLGAYIWTEITEDMFPSFDVSDNQESSDDTYCHSSRLRTLISCPQISQLSDLS